MADATLRATADPSTSASTDAAIAVIGAGQMGNGIAHVFAQSGFDVTMIDVAEAALQRGRADDREEPRPQVKKGTLDAADEGRDARPR